MPLLSPATGPPQMVPRLDTPSRGGKSIRRDYLLPTRRSISFRATSAKLGAYFAHS